MAAEPLVQVLLVLHTRSVLPPGEVLEVTAGQLRRRRLGRATHQHEEERGHKHLRCRGHGEKGGRRGRGGGENTKALR